MFFSSEAILQIFSLKKRGIKLLGTINTIIISFPFFLNKLYSFRYIYCKGEEDRRKKLKTK